MARFLMLLLAGLGCLAASTVDLAWPLALLVGAAGGGFGWLLGSMVRAPGGSGGDAAGTVPGDGGAHRTLVAMLFASHAQPGQDHHGHGGPPDRGGFGGGGFGDGGGGG